MTKSTKILLGLLFAGIYSYAQDIQQSILQLENSTGAKVTTNRSFGTASFVRFSLNQRLALQGANARDKAIDFLNQYKSIY
ncbi:MAG: hypothetical protein KJP09_03440, partial [Bacteroidia bacterium]|nr:hypothetical protein [Bacteroidia bacterium]